MIKIMKHFVIMAFTLLVFTGCNTDQAKVTQEDVFSYKNSYVGDNGAVGSITKALPSPAGEHVSSLELQTKVLPYGLILNYEHTDSAEMVEINYEETGLFNATYLFCLIQNVEWVQFNFAEKQIRVNREELQKWYGKDL
ncbi:DUF4825 domain-containing protein [Bacillus suaedaesalsae]|uniref:DUF4825 domain-containing protein n=1 Tax=Bacillus suaedaesalsae TaxID=2810349 RepID=A0ABS2DH86_9BACI|nr:DUF4825 domain-containing protein [Bacillus suaedaesalsae]MBM6617839.1 DUF4825 domain-containing protein [Bacillus suaedaesalsae]